MTALAELKADQARIWGSASWQQIAERQLFPVHDELIARLGRARVNVGSTLPPGPAPSPSVPRALVPESRAKTWPPS